MGSRKDAFDPIVVPCSSSPKASVTLAFDRLKCYLEVRLRSVDAPNMTLQIDAIVKSYRRPESVDVSKETDKSKWLPGETFRVTLDGEGRIGSSFHYSTLRALAVYLDVYAVGDSYSRTALQCGLNALRLGKNLTDVELKVDGAVFPAHQTVLAANSPVFHRMFTCDMKESKTRVVEVEGFSSTAFGVFLELLYKGSVADWKDCEPELLGLASKYMVDHLKDVCEERLLTLPRLALTVLQGPANNPFISRELRADAVRVVAEGFDAVSETQQWKDFEASNPVAADSIRLANRLV